MNRYKKRKIKNKELYYIYDTIEKKKISDEWLYIHNAGLVNGKSNFYIVKDENYKEHIFYWNSKRNVQITNKGWEKVYFYGLVNGQSNYYITKCKNNIFYLFDKNNKLYLKFKTNDIFENYFYNLIRKNISKEELLQEIVKKEVCK